MQLHVKFVCLVLFSALSMISVSAQASQEIGSSTITGLVKFEPRYTWVTQTVCSNPPCAQSEKYWAMVVYSSGKKYTLNEKLALGEEKAPESIEIAGVTLRPGSYVKIEGEVVEGPGEFLILTQVRSVNLVMDVLYVCHSAKETDPNLVARISQASEGVYQIQIQKVEGRAIYPVVRVNPATLQENPDAVVFSGKIDSASPAADVSILIQRHHQRSGALASSLKLVQTAPAGLGQAVAEAQELEVEMSCAKADLGTGL